MNKESKEGNEGILQFFELQRFIDCATKHDSSDVPLRGGPTRKSEEGSVMESEQRGWTGTVKEQQQEDWKNAQQQTSPGGTVWRETVTYGSVRDWG